MQLDKHSAEQIHRAQLSAIYDQIPANLLPAFIISTIVIISIWESQYAILLTSWLMTIYGYFVIRLFSYFKFKKEEQHDDDNNYKKWATTALYQSLFCGIIWASLPIIYVDLSAKDPTLLLAIFFFSTTGFIGLTVSHYSFLPMWFAFVVPTTGAMLYILFNSPMADTNMMAFYLFLFNFFLFSMMNRNKKSLVETTLLKNEYAHLMVRLQTEKDKSQQANFDKSRFLASASHDLRQPVHALNLFIEMLRKQSLPQDVNHIISRIANSANNLHSMFNSLLDISRLDSDTIDINIHPCDLQSITSELIQIHLADLEAKELAIETDIQEQYILTDPVFLKRILGNLIVNAIHYTESGTIHINSKAVSDSVMISVSDTGCGIPQEYQNKIFDEFKQLNNPERDRNKGLGLGLAICKRLAGLLNTHITVSSQIGVGSCFSICVPRTTEAKLNEQSEIHQLSQIGLGESDLEPYAIMIIDDEQDIVDAISLLLQSWGCKEIATASNDVGALAAMDNGFHPDLVISDYRLRNHLTGLEVINKISDRINYPVRAVLISGDTAPESLKRMKDSGLKILHKPIHTRQLEEVIIQGLL